MAGRRRKKVTFNNYGLVDLQAGTLTCNGNMNNSGTVNLSPGTTNILADGGTESGPFTTPATAFMQWTGNGFSAAFTVNAWSQFLGGGLFEFDGATVNLNTNFAVQNFNLNATINGSGNLTISNVMNWLTGSMNGSGSAGDPDRAGRHA